MLCFAQSYSIEPVSALGSFGGSGPIYAGGEVNGIVTGFAYEPDNRSYHAFYSIGSTFRDLGTLGGNFSSGNAISAWGVAGRATLSASDPSYQAFLWAPLPGFSVLSPLGTLGGSYSSALAINSAGVPAGYSTLTGDTVYHAFVLVAGIPKDLGTLGGNYSAALGINISQTIVGYATLPGDVATHAFSYASGSMVDLGTLGGTFSSAAAINDAGQITGRAATADNTSYHAFLTTSNGSMTDLGTLGGANSSGQGIGAAGAVVGYADTGTTTHAFVAFGGTMYDLNNLIDSADPNRPYITLVNAKSIRDTDEITPAVVGYLLALGKDSRTNAESWYLLTLTAPPASATPRALTTGQTATFTVTPVGPGPFTYQWFQGASTDTSQPIQGATQGVFTTPALAANTNYWALVGTPLGKEATATLSVKVSGESSSSSSSSASSSNSMSSSTSSSGNPTSSSTSSSSSSSSLQSSSPPAGQSGGGGAMDALSLIALMLSAAQAVIRRRS